RHHTVGENSDLHCFPTRRSSDLPGRLLHTNILGCAFFSSVCGSSTATTATIGKMTSQVLVERGYAPGVSIGSLAGAGTLGLMIPDRKSTRLNSSHVKISYAVFCL